MPISGAASPLALPVLNLPATGGHAACLGCSERTWTSQRMGAEAPDPRTAPRRRQCQENWMPDLSSSDAIRLSVFAHTLTLAAIVVLYNWFGQTYLLGLQFAYVFLYFLLGLLIAPITALAVTAFFRDKQSWKKIVGIMVPSYCLTILGELLNELWFNRKDIIYNGFTECLQAVISSPTAPLVYYGLHGWPTIVYRLGWRSASLGKRNTNLY